MSYSVLCSPCMYSALTGRASASKGDTQIGWRDPARPLSLSVKEVPGS